VPLSISLSYRVVARVLVLTFPNAHQPRLVEIIDLLTGEINDLSLISDESNSLTLKRLGVEVDQITQIPHATHGYFGTTSIPHLLFPNL